MIEILIFHFHILGALYAFTKNWQKHGLKDGVMAILIIGLIFMIGWTLSGAIANVIMPSNFKSIYFTKDTLSLVLLFIPECFFFFYFFIKDKPAQNNVAQK
jgi:hypothetical protein